MALPGPGWKEPVVYSARAVLAAVRLGRLGGAEKPARNIATQDHMGSPCGTDAPVGDVIAAAGPWSSGRAVNRVGEAAGQVPAGAKGPQFIEFVLREPSQYCSDIGHGESLPTGDAAGAQGGWSLKNQARARKLTAYDVPVTSGKRSGKGSASAGGPGCHESHCRDSPGPQYLHGVMLYRSIPEIRRSGF